MSEDRSVSIKWIVILLILLVSSIAWCFFASEYAKEVDGWTPAGGDLVHGRSSFAIASVVAMFSMIINGFQQIPNARGIIAFTFAERLWSLMGLGLLIGLVIAGGAGMKWLERELNASPKRRW